MNYLHKEANIDVKLSRIDRILSRIDSICSIASLLVGVIQGGM